MKKTIFYLTTLSLISLLLPSTVFADCKCGKAKTTDESYKSSDMVFLGQVVSVDKASAIHEGHKVIKLMITVPYKGTDLLPATEYVTVFSEDGPCGVEFVRQSDYLIFAKGQPAFLKTSVCDLTEIQETSREKQVRVEKLSKGE